MVRSWPCSAWATVLTLMVCSVWRSLFSSSSTLGPLVTSAPGWTGTNAEEEAELVDPRLVWAMRFPSSSILMPSAWRTLKALVALIWSLKSKDKVVVSTMFMLQAWEFCHRVAANGLPGIVTEDPKCDLVILHRLEGRFCRKAFIISVQVLVHNLLDNVLLA